MLLLFLSPRPRRVLIWTAVSRFVLCVVFGGLGYSRPSSCSLGFFFVIFSVEVNRPRDVSNREVGWETAVEPGRGDRRSGLSSLRYWVFAFSKSCGEVACFFVCRCVDAFRRRAIASTHLTRDPIYSSSGRTFERQPASTGIPLLLVCFSSLFCSCCLEWSTGGGGCRTPWTGCRNIVVLFVRSFVPHIISNECRFCRISGYTESSQELGK
ncbi:unnamed protein product [Hapterophycus canaliculatus]